jgi:hypothetical protein
MENKATWHYEHFSAYETKRMQQRHLTDFSENKILQGTQFFTPVNPWALAC